MLIVCYWPGDTSYLSFCATKTNQNLKAIYGSFFPTVSLSKTFKLHTYNGDPKGHSIGDFIVLPTQEENGYGFSEAQIAQWWCNDFAKKPKEFSWFSYNCSGLVFDAIQHGAKNDNLKQKLARTKPFICTPSSVTSYFKNLSREMVRQNYLFKHKDLVNDHTLALKKIYDSLTQRQISSKNKNYQTQTVQKLSKITSCLAYLNDVMENNDFPKNSFCAKLENKLMELYKELKKKGLLQRSYPLNYTALPLDMANNLSKLTPALVDFIEKALSKFKLDPNFVKKELALLK